MSVEKIVEGIRNFLVGDNPVYQDPNGGPISGSYHCQGLNEYGSDPVTRCES